MSIHQESSKKKRRRAEEPAKGDSDQLQLVDETFAERKERKKRRHNEKAAGDILQGTPGLDASLEREKLERPGGLKKRNKSRKKRDAEPPGLPEFDTALDSGSEQELPRKEKKQKSLKRKAGENDNVETIATLENGKEAKSKAKMEADAHAVEPLTTVPNEKEKLKKHAKAEKKERQKKKKQAQAESNGAAGENQNGVAGEGGQAESASKTRFVVFIGNLPFSANDNSIRKHFAVVKPTQIRHRVQPDDPTKSKGFCFLEFDNYDRLKTCLKNFHHSSFNDGISPARQINVELSAGGGGNGVIRKEKLKTKNHRLNEQRTRRQVEEEKLKGKARNSDEAQVEESHIHPSRRGQVNEF